MDKIQLNENKYKTVHEVLILNLVGSCHE